MSQQNPLDIIGQHFLVELMNPNPRMSPLKGGDRFTVAFEVDKETLDYFIDAGADGRAGMIIEAVMKVTERHGAVGDVSEQTQEPEPKPKLKGGELSKLAGMWCSDQRFIAWLERTRAMRPISKDEAAEHIRKACGVESRAELDHSKDGAKRFDVYFRRPYSAYLEQSR